MKIFVRCPFCSEDFWIDGANRKPNPAIYCTGCGRNTKDTTAATGNNQNGVGTAFTILVIIGLAFFLPFVGFVLNGG